MKEFLTGNEAIALGALEAGVSYACAYPGTPSTEILETLAQYKDEIVAEWGANEKVALEAAIGASIAGARSLSAMKMVGVNVASDALLTVAYSGITGGLVLVSADDPGLHSSQNEQDNRYYAKFGKVAMFEPSDSQECLDMLKEAYEVSERFETPVLFRVTTRICHSKSVVVRGERIPERQIPYRKNLAKYDLIPAVSRRLHYVLEDRLQALAAYSNTCRFNVAEYHDRRIGIVASGVAYQYAKEVFGERASYFKVGFSNPMPMEQLRAFAAEVETLYVIEELEPFMEEQLRAAGIACIGKEKIPICGELNPAIIAKALLGEETRCMDCDTSAVAARPPVLCAGCPHRGFYYALAKYRNVVISGDIGCYSLGGIDPLNAKDFEICMGSSSSVAHGAQVVFDRFGNDRRVVATMGDSTFFHTGINSLINAIYNNSRVISVILDNRITGMTGHQENPGSGATLQGAPSTIMDIERIVRALGYSHVWTINPLDLTAVKQAIDNALDHDGPSVIVTRWPCALKKFSEADLSEFGQAMGGKCTVNEAKCTGCEFCLKTGCPAIRFDREAKKAHVDEVQCTGCSVCTQVCWTGAIADQEVVECAK